MADQPRRELRKASDGSLDDVVVEGVEMFRAEVLDNSTLWLACYLAGTGTQAERVTFEVSVKDGRLRFEVGEMPGGEVAP